MIELTDSIASQLAPPVLDAKQTVYFAKIAANFYLCKKFLVHNHGSSITDTAKEFAARLTIPGHRFSAALHIAAV